MAEEQTFQMTPTTLAAAIANAAKRERRRAARLLDDKADDLLGRGDLAGAQLMSEMAESIRSADIPEPDRAMASADPTDAAEPALPEVHHLDDFAEGVALVQGGGHRRGVVGYNGASGHLRD